MNIGILFNNTSLSKSHRSLEAKTDRWLNFCIRVIRQTPIQALTGCRGEVLLIGYRLFFFDEGVRATNYAEARSVLHIC